jgi:hypothetical protein
MKSRTKGLLYLLGFIGLLAGFLIGRPAWQARRPSDMPANSIWIDAPAVPFGFYRGWWLGCWIDSDRTSNRCKLWGSGDLKVVYEGLYISCDDKSPVRADELQPSTQREVDWVGYSKGNIFAPAVYLQNGKVLVPSDAPSACEELQVKNTRK